MSSTSAAALTATRCGRCRGPFEAGTIHVASGAFPFACAVVPSRGVWVCEACLERVEVDLRSQRDIRWRIEDHHEVCKGRPG